MKSNIFPEVSLNEEEQKRVDAIKSNPDMMKKMAIYEKYINLLDKRIEQVQKSNMNVFKRIYNSIKLHYVRNDLFERVRKAVNDQNAEPLNEMVDLLKETISVLAKQVKTGVVIANNTTKMVKKQTTPQKQQNKPNNKKNSDFAKLYKGMMAFFNKQKKYWINKKDDVKERLSSALDRAKGDPDKRLSRKFSNFMGRGGDYIENILNAPEFVSRIVSNIAGKIGSGIGKMFGGLIDILWNNKVVIGALTLAVSLFSDNFRKIIVDSFNTMAGTNYQSFTDVIASVSSSKLGALGLTGVGAAVGSAAGPWGALIGAGVGALTGIISNIIGESMTGRILSEAGTTIMSIIGKNDDMEHLKASLYKLSENTEKYKEKLLANTNELNKLEAEKRDALEKGDGALFSSIVSKIDALKASTKDIEEKLRDTEADIRVKNERMKEGAQGYFAQLFISLKSLSDTIMTGIFRAFNGEEYWISFKKWSKEKEDQMGQLMKDTKEKFSDWYDTGLRTVDWLGEQFSKMSDGFKSFMTKMKEKIDSWFGDLFKLDKGFDKPNPNFVPHEPAPNNSSIINDMKRWFSPTGTELPKPLQKMELKSPVEQLEREMSNFQTIERSRATALMMLNNNARTSNMNNVSVSKNDVSIRTEPLDSSIYSLGYR